MGTPLMGLRPEPAQVFDFLPQGGQAGARIRSIDWENHPLGSPESWPLVLKHTLGVILGSCHPMFLWWGPELFQFYNDAYLPSFDGKHPSAMGQRGRECWPETWPIIWPQIRDALTEGKPSWHENRLIPIFRNGRIENVYWTYGYSPIVDESGKIMGVLVVCSETTQQVLAAEALRKSEARARKAEERLSEALDNAQMNAWEFNLKTGNLEIRGGKSPLFGVDIKDEDIFEVLRRHAHPDDVSRMTQRLEETFKERKLRHDEFRIVRPDGSVRWIMTRGKSKCDPTGKPVSMSGVITDITSLKFSKRESRLSAAKALLAILTASEAPWSTTIMTLPICV
jgi:PAS domain-containing protein